MSNGIKTIVLGIGNILLGDEGIGVKIIKELEQEDLPEHVKLIDGATAGFGLLPILEKYKDCKFLIIDAIKIINNENDNKGDFYIAPLDKLCEEDNKDIKFISFHQTGILDVLNLLHLSSKTKINGYLFGINIYNSRIEDDVLKFSMDLSPNIKDKIPYIKENLKKYL